METNFGEYRGDSGEHRGGGREEQILKLELRRIKKAGSHVITEGRSPSIRLLGSHTVNIIKSQSISCNLSWDLGRGGSMIVATQISVVENSRLKFFT